MDYGIHINHPENLIQTIEKARKLKCSSIQIFLGDKIKTTLKYKYNYSKEEIINIKNI